MTALTLALAPGVVAPLNEPWTTPDLLGYAKAEESVDLASVCLVASHILYLLSGRRFGVRTETIRPRADSGWCSLSENTLILKGPVQSIVSVQVDGVTLDPAEYALYDSRTLLRLPGGDGLGLRWPTYQRLDLPLTEVGTMSVTYQWGTPVPEGGKLAAQVFATELAKYINKDGSALPDRTVSVTRQGVTQTLLDPSEFIKQSRTGLYLVDIWLGSVNPNGLKRRPTISNPDTITNARPT